jgi:CubicO group peptidase (beta-lactamase class C family)
MRRPLRLLFAALALNCLATQTQATNHDAPQRERVETLLRAEMENRGIPGLQAAVVRHGEIVLQYSRGLANVEHSVPVANHTVFPINSGTKAFVGVAIMQLAEDGKLVLAAPAGDYLSDLPSEWKKIPLRHLLTHTSGLPDMLDPVTERFLGGDSEEAAWQRVRGLPMNFAPGEQFRYNQTNYYLLGRIVEQLSGRHFEQFIAERQFRPANMSLTEKSSFSDSYDVVPDSAQSYKLASRDGNTLQDAENLRHMIDEIPVFVRTASGIYSTASETAQWIIALQEGKLLKDVTSRDALWAPGVLKDGSTAGFGDLLNGYALGWPTMVRERHQAVGGIGGGRAAFFVYPDDDLAIVIFTNLAGSNPEMFVDDVAACYLKDLPSSIQK